MLGPKHGYELHQEFSQELGGVWQIGLSQLYAQLKHLEDVGLVSSTTEPQTSRPARKVYSLTPQGRQAFAEWVQQPTPYLRHIRVEFLARLYFFQRLSLPGLGEFVARQKGVCQEQMERFGQLAAQEEDAYRRLVFEFRQGQLRAVDRWLDRCLEVL